MTDEQFTGEYRRIVERAMLVSDISRREGLLAIEDEIDRDKIKRRDVFELGIRLVVDGMGNESIDKILSNIIAQESDTQRRLLLTIQKEAAPAIREGENPHILELQLNVYVNIDVEAVMERLMAPQPHRRFIV